MIKKHGVDINEAALGVAEDLLATMRADLSDQTERVKRLMERNKEATSRIVELEKIEGALQKTVKVLEAELVEMSTSLDSIHAAHYVAMDETRQLTKTLATRTEAIVQLAMRLGEYRNDRP